MDFLKAFVFILFTICLPKRKLIFQPSIFRCELLVSGLNKAKRPFFFLVKPWRWAVQLHGRVDFFMDST